MKTTRRLRAFLLALLLAVSACMMGGCRKQRNGKLEIAVIVKSTSSDFFHAIQSGVEAAAIEYNVSVTYEGPESEEDYETQNALIRAAMERGVDAIVLSAIDEKQTAAIVEEASRQGIKVVTIDSDVASEAVSLFVGTDNFGAGKVAAEAVLDAFSGFTETIRVGLVSYMEATENGRERESGFRAYIESLPNVQIAATATAQSNLESATECALALLREHPEINVLVGLNEWMTLGVGYAIRQANAVGRVRGVGFDSNVISIDMLERGEMNALIVQNPFAIGYLGVKWAADLVEGASGNRKSLYTDVTIITSKNLFDEDIQKILFRV